MERIENCPCRGGEGQLKDTRGKIRQGCVGCPACQLYISWKISPEGAVKKWNRRATRSTTVRLTPAAVNLLKYMPEVVNELAARLQEKLDEYILYGEQGTEAGK